MYRYSQRLSWDGAPNAFTRSIEAQRRTGASLLDLTISNPTQAFVDYPHKAIEAAYAAAEDFTYLPNPFGHEATRRAITNLYAGRGIAISPDRIVLTASTSEAYALLFKLFCDPETEVLAPRPSYPLFEYLSALESVRIAPYRLIYDGAWFIDWTNLHQQISDGTRAIVIVNPNNPTGSFLKRHEAKELFRIAQEHSLPVISDEVFLDYSFGQGPERVRSLTGTDSILSFSLDGLSKTAGMPQMKLAWIVINGPDEQAQIARRRLELLLDTYLSVSTPVQCAAPQLLEIGAKFQQLIGERTRRNWDSLRNLLLGAPAHALHLEGGWSAIVQLPRTLSEETWVTRLLEEHGVIVHPGYFFDMESGAYVVVSLITPPKQFDEGLKRLRKLAISSCDANLHVSQG